MKAVIMAGGEGTRLRPLTNTQPKPMMPLANRPMMEHIVGLLTEHGLDDVVVTVAYLANQIRTYFGDGSEYGVRMRYATEETPLGTAGSVRNASAELDDTFLVISGDVLTDIDLTEVLKAHRDSGADATIALKRVDNPLEFGIVITREDGSIERFLEKPGWGQVFSDTINTGIYVLEPRVFDFIPEGEIVDFSGDVFPAMLEEGLSIHGHVADGYWEDVGTLEAYLRAHADVLDGTVKVDIAGFRISENVWMGEGSDIDPRARIDGPVVIGDNCIVEAGAHLREYTVLGTDVVVKHDAFVERSVIHDHGYLASSVRMRGCVAGRSVDLRQGVHAEEGVVLGDETFVGDGAVLNPGVKIFPFKSVDAGAVVTASIVWESHGARTLFGARGVRGLANVDITPEVAVRLAGAYGTALKKGSVVTISRDTSRAARSLKRAVIAGLNMAGIRVEDLELAPVPLTRFHVRSERAQGAITVRLAPGDPNAVEIRFFDADGRDMPDAAQRKIERLLAREDYRRAFAGDIGAIVFPPRAFEYYTAALEDSVDAAAIRSRGFKVVLDYSFGASSIVMPNVLAKIGAEVLAVNPYASTAPALATVSDDSRGPFIEDLVRTSRSDLGLVLDPDGETAKIVDDTGRTLSPTQATLAVVSLVTSTVPGAKIALPVSTTAHARRIADENGAEVVWTKLAMSAVTEIADRSPIDLAVAPDGGFIWADFLPASDATATLAKLLGLLVAGDRPLSEVVATLPEVHVVREEVPTPWERKGAVMRAMIERTKDREVLLIDGVKVMHDDSWALVLPDPEEPLTHVWAEAASEPEALQLAQEYARRIRQIMR